MASACVNKMGMSPENFLDGPAPYTSFGWLSPRISMSRDEESAENGAPPSSSDPSLMPDPEAPGGKDAVDFEFRLEDPVAMLPADELFYDGKLMPLQVSSAARPVAAAASTDVRSTPEAAESQQRSEVSGTDPYLFSPRAPRCSSRWRELLGLKKLYQQSNVRRDNHKTTSLLSSSVPSKSVKHFLHRNSKSSSSSSSDASLSLPLLRDSDCCEAMSISSRLSLSSSSSSHDYEDLPGRLSLDSDKPNHSPNPNPTPSASQISLSKNLNPNPNPARVRVVKHRGSAPLSSSSDHHHQQQSNSNGTGARMVASVESPRMNSSGKVVFQSLERSSSSPSSFNGGPRCKHRPGIERSYSANVRVTPVLNVPVCSLRGSSKSGVFGFFSSSPQKRDPSSGNAAGGSTRTHHQHPNSRNRPPADRA